MRDKSSPNPEWVSEIINLTKEDNCKEDKEPKAPLRVQNDYLFNS